MTRRCLLATTSECLVAAGHAAAHPIAASPSFSSIMEAPTTARAGRLVTYEIQQMATPDVVLKATLTLPVAVTLIAGGPTPYHFVGGKPTWTTRGFRGPRISGEGFHFVAQIPLQAHPNVRFAVRMEEWAYSTDPTWNAHRRMTMWVRVVRR